MSKTSDFSYSRNLPLTNSNESSLEKNKEQWFLKALWSFISTNSRILKIKISSK